MSKVIGIDISKDTFDACFFQAGGKQNSAVFANAIKGFKELEEQLCKEDHVVMEATGPYYLQLACFLYELGYQVSVVNPLVIKHFTRMRLSRTKTDKKDAYLIACYGQTEKPSLWHPDLAQIASMNQAFMALEGLEKQATMLKNQLGALNVLPAIDETVVNCLKRTLEAIGKEFIILQQYLEALAEEYFPETYRALQTIPGIGKKTSVLLIVITNNFQNFDNSRKLLSYAGLVPRIYNSGTSVKGKAKICKMGMSRIRKTMYMCSWSAMRYNEECKAIHERLKAKGKPARVIKIAIANKLLRTAFAVGKNLTPYEKNYHGKFAY